MNSNSTTYWITLSTHWSEDRTKKAVVCQDIVACCPFVDFFENEVYIKTIAFPGKSTHYAEDSAENFTLGILNV